MYEVTRSIIRLAREANEAGDKERVNRCLDLLAEGNWDSAWDAVERDTRAATQSAVDAAWRGTDDEAFAAAEKLGKP